MAKTYQFSFKRAGKNVRMCDGWSGEILAEADGTVVCLEKGKPNELTNVRTFNTKCAASTKGNMTKLVENVFIDSAGETYVKLFDERKQLNAFLRRAKVARTWDSAPR